MLIVVSTVSRPIEPVTNKLAIMNSVLSFDSY